MKSRIRDATLVFLYKCTDRLTEYKCTEKERAKSALKNERVTSALKNEWVTSAQNKESQCIKHETLLSERWWSMFCLVNYLLFCSVDLLLLQHTESWAIIGYIRMPSRKAHVDIKNVYYA